jgi:hypothetical protein
MQSRAKRSTLGSVKQPWMTWTWKQRALFAAALVLVSTGLLAFQSAADSPGATLVCTLLELIILPPALYVFFSSTKHAQRRFEHGDDSVYGPRVTARLRADEDSSSRPGARGIHRSWLLWSVLTGALTGGVLIGVTATFGHDSATLAGVLGGLVIYLIVFLVVGQIAAMVQVRRGRTA